MTSPGRITRAIVGGGSRTNKGPVRHRRPQALRLSFCFRVFLGMIALQILVLVLIGHMLDSSSSSADSSFPGRGLRSFQKLRKYLPTFHRYTDNKVGADDSEETSFPNGIVVDDDYASGANAQAHLHDHHNDDLHELEDHLANQTEQQLDRPNASPLTDESSPVQNPIDNYYTRKQHRKPPPQKPPNQQNNIYGSEEPPFNFLIVGGSDGSGTRSVVSALAKLGVPMLVEDRQTMDIHGGMMFDGHGWPPMVQMILNHTHSANYEISDLPQDIQNTVIPQLTRLQMHLNIRGERNVKRQIQRVQRQGRLNHYDSHQEKHPVKKYFDVREKLEKYGHRRLLETRPEALKALRHKEIVEEVPLPSISALNNSRAVKYGWKAPVSMLMLPFLRKVFGPIKFIHVVRDGRDVCLSENQSPVKKFYNSYYKKTVSFGDDKEGSPRNDTAMNIRAMELWNDWNSEVLEYEMKHASADDFDYLILRTEDLLSPLTKFQALQQLADFVGSPQSMQDICCQSLQAVVDMGESVAGFGKKGPREHRGFGSAEALKTFQEKLNSHNAWFHAFDHGSNEFATSALGQDPVLAYIRGGGNDDPLEDMDRKYRHSGWHHGLLDADAIKENAKRTRMEFLRNRNQRYKNLADRLSAINKKRAEFKNQNQDQKTDEKDVYEGENHRRLLGSFSKLQLRASHYRPRKTKPVPKAGGEKLAQYREDHRLFKPRRNKDEDFLHPVRPSNSWTFTSKLRAWFGFQSTQQPMPMTETTSKPLAPEAKAHKDSKPKTEVTARYGKWMNALKDKPAVSAAIHVIGKEALAAFGYQPQMAFMDVSGDNHDFQCDSTISCPDPHEVKQYSSKLVLH